MAGVLGVWLRRSPTALGEAAQKRPRGRAGEGGGGTGEVAQGKTPCTQLPGSGFTPV